MESLECDRNNVPMEGITFYSEKEMRDYYVKYAESVGFDVSKKSTKCGEDGRQRYYSLACSHYTTRTLSSGGTDHVFTSSSYKTSCKARINVTVKGDNLFMITRVILDHNHELTPTNRRFFRYNKEFKPYTKRKSSIDLIGNMSMKKGNRSPPPPSIIQDGDDHEEECVILETKPRRLNLGNDGAEALQNFLSHMQLNNSDFFYSMNLDDECCVRNIFWADATSRAAYELFSDVVLFDTTYLDNHYDMPLVCFVGVNHHGQLVLLGCGLVSTYLCNTESFLWLLKSWLTCMRGRHPKAIVSNDNEYIRSAVFKIFPNSHHCIGSGYIMKTFSAMAKGINKSDQLKISLENSVYHSFQPSEFEEKWKAVIDIYNLNDHKWFKSIYADRHRWVPVYTRRIFLAGLSEGDCINGFFDEYVDPKTTLKQFLQQYEKARESSMNKEKNADFASQNFVLPTMTNHPIEKQLQKLYTNDIFKLFQEELKELMFCNASLSKAKRLILTYDVAESFYNKLDGMFLKEVNFEVCIDETECQMNCTCCLFQHRGVLCRHIISVLIKSNLTEIPSRYVLRRWRKMIKVGGLFFG